ncbi:MAG: hypothetical protein ABI321_11370 [Polyangia bacterium]
MRNNDSDTKEESALADRAERISSLTECVRTNTYAVDLVELADALTTAAMQQTDEPTKR